MILEGCITVGTEPFEQLDGQYITIGPFYAPYQCAGINNYNTNHVELKLRDIIIYVWKHADKGSCVHK